MLRNTLIGLFVGTSLSLGGLFIDSASAQTQPPNASDITGAGPIAPIINPNTPSNLQDISGTNISTFTQFDGSNFQLNEAIINQGEQLASDIIEAFNSETSSDITPLDLNRTNVASSRCQRIRRFSIDKPEANSNNCNQADNRENSEFDQLNALLNKADDFIEDIDRQVETANRAINNRLW